jgi:Sulfotransferase family
MAPELWRERVLDTTCWLAGVAGRAVRFKATCPIFIIGTGRCGTTVLVNILKTHPSLLAFPGEANELWHCKLEPFETTSLDIPPIEVDPKRFSEVSVANWPSRHGERIRDIFAGFQLITGSSKILFTKSAAISFMIPKILELFPEARFMHIYRFGPSVVESYFKKNFGKYSRFTFTEKEYRAYCATYWNACIMEIEQRKNDFSLEAKGQFIEFSYEDLCQNARKVLDSIAEFIGVTSDGYRFDISQISSQNHKVADYARDPARAGLLDVMAPAMRLKGYTIDRPCVGLGG